MYKLHSLARLSSLYYYSPRMYMIIVQTVDEFFTFNPHALLVYNFIIIIIIIVDNFAFFLTQSNVVYI